jgi:hypothetical protein
MFLPTPYLSPPSCASGQVLLTVNETNATLVDNTTVGPLASSSGPVDSPPATNETASNQTVVGGTAPVTQSPTTVQDPSTGQPVTVISALQALRQDRLARLQARTTALLESITRGALTALAYATSMAFPDAPIEDNPVVNGTVVEPPRLGFTVESIQRTDDSGREENVRFDRKAFDQQLDAAVNATMTAWETALKQLQARWTNSSSDGNSTSGGLNFESGQAPLDTTTVTGTAGSNGTITSTTTNLPGTGGGASGGSSNTTTAGTGGASGGSTTGTTGGTSGGSSNTTAGTTGGTSGGSSSSNTTAGTTGGASGGSSSNTTAGTTGGVSGGSSNTTTAAGTSGTVSSGAGTVPSNGTGGGQVLESGTGGVGTGGAAGGAGPVGTSSSSASAGSSGPNGASGPSSSGPPGPDVEIWRDRKGRKRCKVGHSQQKTTHHVDITWLSAPQKPPLRAALRLSGKIAFSKC